MSTSVIEVIRNESGRRVSIQPNLVEARKSVGSIALERGEYSFRPADLNVVWIVFRSGLDYDECDELLAVFDNFDRARYLLDRLGDYGYHISCAEINYESGAVPPIAGLGIG